MTENINKKGLEKLKKIRKKHNLSGKDMAEKLGISKAFYCQIENKTRKLSYNMAIRIANIFSVKPDKVFYDDFKDM